VDASHSRCAAEDAVNEVREKAVDEMKAVREKGKDGRNYYTRECNGQQACSRG